MAKQNGEATKARYAEPRRRRNRPRRPGSNSEAHGPVRKKTPDTGAAPAASGARGFKGRAAAPRRSPARWTSGRWGWWCTGCSAAESPGTATSPIRPVLALQQGETGRAGRDRGSVGVRGRRRVRVCLPLRDALVRDERYGTREAIELLQTLVESRSPIRSLPDTLALSLSPRCPSSSSFPSLALLLSCSRSP